MEEEKGKCKECVNCGNYSQYYTKGYYKFNKVKCGHCRYNQKIVESHDTCEHWSNISYRYRNFSNHATKKALQDILGQLAQIRQVMEENAENGSD